MCFYSQITNDAQSIVQRFNAKFETLSKFTPSKFNGFQYPLTPVIADNKSDEIQFFNWGLIPSWAKDESIRKNTLNARIETIHEKPSFKPSVNKRCLIISDGFYEWQWLDSKGKNKQKYLINLPDITLFAFAGLWSEWRNPDTGTLIHSYAILTTEANELMSKIHNIKKRMPIILSEDNEMNWLNGSEMTMQNERLVASIEDDSKLTYSLFN